MDPSEGAEMTVIPEPGTRRELGSATGPLLEREVEPGALCAQIEPARLVADIAQASIVTVKTVEVHLSRAYRNLGIESRRQLVCALAPPVRIVGAFER